MRGTGFKDRGKAEGRGRARAGAGLRPHSQREECPEEADPPPGGEFPRGINSDGGPLASLYNTG